jgi:hypothetical protein
LIGIYYQYKSQDTFFLIQIQDPVSMVQHCVFCPIYSSASVKVAVVSFELTHVATPKSTKESAFAHLVRVATFEKSLPKKMNLKKNQFAEQATENTKF